MTRRMIALSCLLAICFGSSNAVFACGPYVLETFFTTKRHPEFPLKPYTQGKAGVVPSTYGPMSLVLFHRMISGVPLSASEQSDAVAAMEHSIYYRRSFDDSGNWEIEEKKVTPVETWLASRAKVTDEKREVDVDRGYGDYGYFINCLSDAFTTASQTLEDRLKKHGPSAEVKDWTAAQDLVFGACSGDSPIPQPASGPEWLRKDREYQIAASKFYRTSFSEARDAFDAIAADSQSPWANAARLASARAFIREASLLPEGKTPEENAERESRNRALLVKAEAALRSILSSDRMRDYHRSALGLLGLVKFRMSPTDRRAELGKVLLSPAENRNFRNDLFDYSLLWDRVYDAAYDRGTEADRKEAEAAGREYDYIYRLKLRDIPASDRSDDVTEWIVTYGAADGFAHSFDKWKQTGKLEWLVAAISKAEASSAGTSDLIAAASRVAIGSPAFPTVRYHHIRLMLAAGKTAEAKRLYDEIGSLTRFPVSTQNLFLAQRAALATTLDEYLEFAQRKPVMFSWMGDSTEQPSELEAGSKLKLWETRTMFDADGAAFFNHRAPLSVVADAAVDPKLPEHLRKMVATAVLIRAFMLKDQALERRFAPIVAGLTKASMPEFAEYSSARTPVDREAAALIAILRNPVVQPYVPTGFGREDSEPTTIDSIRGNWWCNSEHAKEPDIAFPTFLTTQQIATAAEENKRLKDLGESATALTRRAVEFATKNPKHARTPEILHLAVRSTRYGCTDTDTGAISKRAFDTLHRQYKTSPWTKRTPYWFGN